MVFLYMHACSKYLYGSTHKTIEQLIVRTQKHLKLMLLPSTKQSNKVLSRIDIIKPYDLLEHRSIDPILRLSYIP